MQSIERAFSILRALAAGSGSSGVSEVARATGLPKSTTSRILAGLEDLGMVDRVDDAGRYVVGAGLATLTGDTLPAGSLRDLCRPYLLELTERSGEGAGLAIPDRGKVLYVDHVGSASPVQIRDWSGTRYPYHTVAAGLALMTTWSDGEIRDHGKAGLAPFTTHTVTTVTALLAKVRAARQGGVVWTLREFSDEINGISAPILEGGDAVAAVSLYGPAWRFPGEVDASEIEDLLRETAGAISARLAP